MKLSDKQQEVALNINEEHCSSCAICSSACPFGAITRDTETGKMLLEIEKCQVCSICYSSCPAKAIHIYYYDINSLLRYLEKAKGEYKADSLVIMCRGSAPDFKGISSFSIWLCQRFDHNAKPNQGANYEGDPGNKVGKPSP